MKLLCFKVLCVFIFFAFISCDKQDEQLTKESRSSIFSWKSELKVTDIPDTPVKGFINGKEINLVYINFEQWRGSGDNVLNFGDVIPKNSCGYVENNNSFHLILKAGEIKVGELLKANFDQNLDGYVAYYDTVNVNQSDIKNSIPWNCALLITEKDDKFVKGKIAICFKDAKMSWIAGTFEAVRCFN